MLYVFNGSKSKKKSLIIYAILSCIVCQIKTRYMKPLTLIIGHYRFQKNQELIVMYVTNRTDKTTQKKGDSPSLEVQVL